MGYNKIIYAGTTLIDLTSDTITAEDLRSGITAHDMSGEAIVGTNAADSDTSSATATAAEVLTGKTFFARGSKVTGSMPNNGAFAGVIETADGEVTVPMGYHDGSGKIKIDDAEKAKLTANNIKMGITILGVTGTVEPSSDVTAQTKTVTPTTEKQTIVPDTEVDYLSQVIVNAIPYTETANTAGGITVTIAG